MGVVYTNWPTQYTKTFAYGSPGSGKTHFAATHPDPVLVDTEEGARSFEAARARLGLPPAPIYQPSDWVDVKRMAVDPLKFFEQAFKGTVWAGYEPKSVCIDTVSSMENDVLDTILKVSAHAYPELGDYKPLAYEMRPLFRLLYRAKMNVLVLAHTFHGGVPMKDKKTGDIKPPAPPGPLLTGALREQAPGIFDFFLYLAVEPVAGKPTYWAYRTTTPEGYPARVRAVEQFLPGNKWRDPDWKHLRQALDRYAQWRDEQKNP